MAAKKPTKTDKTPKKEPKKVDIFKPILEKPPATDYDKMFEKKLSEQYKEFRNLREHHLQMKKFLRMLIILLVIIAVALLLISLNM